MSKPSAGSLEELIALPTSQKTNSPPTTRHKQTTNSPSQTRSGSVEKVVPPNDDPLPTTQLPVATEPSNQLEKSVLKTNHYIIYVVSINFANHLDILHNAIHSKLLSLSSTA